MLVKTGIDRLDELLKGGIPEKSNVLVYANPFIGKDILLKSFALDGLRKGDGIIFVLTDKSFADMKEEMTKIDSKYPEYEEEGAIRYIDAYSPTVELKETSKWVKFVDSPVNRERIAFSILQAHKEMEEKMHRIIFDSISTLIVYSDAKAVFRFLQVLSGTCKRMNTTSLFVMTRGMHEEIEVQTIKHLMDGVIELREKEARYQLRVQGCGEALSRHWIDYLLGENEIKLTGAFRMGRVA